jgi:hypothetical protein
MVCVALSLNCHVVNIISDPKKNLNHLYFKQLLKAKTFHKIRSKVIARDVFKSLKDLTTKKLWVVTTAQGRPPANTSHNPAL